MPKRVRITYCGGCNPRYDRTAVAAKLRAAFPEIGLVEASDDAPAHFVAVICGCPAACASHQDMRGLDGKMVITSEEHYQNLVTAIRAII
jgi:4-hydroxybutyrate CoA-transferase